MVKLFSGTANPKLTQDVSHILQIPISKAEVVRFGNSEVRVRIEEEVRNDICLVVQSTSNPTDTNIIELAFFCDALKREEARKVIGVVPWFGYAKQNIQHRSGECVSVNVIIRFFESIGFNKIYTLDLHDEATAGVFSIPFKNMSAFPLLAHTVSDYFKKNNIDLSEVVVVSPDQGAVEKVRNFGNIFYGHEHFSEAVIEKKRDQNVIHEAKPLALYGDVKDKIALIVDDMVVSGSTLLPAADLCLEKGAKKVLAAIVHHEFTPEAPELLQNSRFEKIFSTNTIALREDQAFPKLIEVSVASLIAEELKYLFRTP